MAGSISCSTSLRIGKRLALLEYGRQLATSSRTAASMIGEQLGQTGISVSLALMSTIMTK